jgi:5-(aminomethyl)-3-furanmethanol phosphate kinase
VKIDAVVKIGGSIIKRHKALKGVLNQIIAESRKGHNVVVVPGGGELADFVRRWHEAYSLTDSTAHWMAIQSMDMNGMLISGTHKRCTPVSTASACIETLRERHIPILLPYCMLRKTDTLPHSWDVTSDSIALYIANILHADKVVLVKDVEGIYKDARPGNIIHSIDARALQQCTHKTCVDAYVHTLITRYSRTVHIVSGIHQGRLANIIADKPTKGTLITPTGHR